MICVQGLSHPGDPSRETQPIWWGGSSLKLASDETTPLHAEPGPGHGPEGRTFGRVGRRTDPLLGVAGQAGSDSLVGPEQILPASLRMTCPAESFLSNSSAPVGETSLSIGASPYLCRETQLHHVELKQAACLNPETRELAASQHLALEGNSKGFPIA